jgi:hypothetical protein
LALSRARRSGIAAAASPTRSRSLQTTSGLPGPVQNLSASATGNTTASLSWSAPIISGDSAVTSYIVTGGGTANVSGTTATITGLTANTSYAFVVRAFNGVGSGLPATAASITTLNFNDATGGTTTEVSNYNGTGQTWRVHTFNSSGTFTVTASTQTFRGLVVGGGGAGGGALGGGGGGGGVNNNTSLTLSNQAYTVTVNGGGATQFVSPGSSSLGSVMTAQGGFGGQGSGNGSNGGASGSPTSNGGGSGNNSNEGGGGGGAGGGGGSSVGNGGGLPGSGLSNNITGGSLVYGTGGQGGTGGAGSAGQGRPGNIGGTVIVSYRIA